MARSSFWADFQKFLMQGNVIDLAVAVIIGAAFGKIVTSFVEDIITPLILNPALKAARVDSLQNLSYEGIKYGVFLASVINFLVIAFAIFLMIRAFEKAKRRFSRQEAIEEAAAPDPLLVSQERLTNAIDRLASKMN
ncbi:large conductance mechanosensitive channel protein [Leptolyngbya boryana NIES-2135]|jgi:large conductance mechanosensitive channel|uniref:Large-conductance mechanosensitive channel n=1 Tax=Leptolyngbya boryana NIES-2135 TaxID=1973484 RepID=A0A1Z4JLA1_LEPBY|nr:MULTISPECIES: large conductance mechanosensitive channel protein MscL [Leptolyngbya]BAY57514.1 large conductance mechanosensitive channel protein [Leptolyngbya boryana NIES-2135]MBD2368549.1 large conductance mechanosensitive channel protein MscL [Leptolyngbya sp. FACHB-161]MBD2375190.1 large conductance mechanosensitive channel protein MscL [Leptolyngbya sp. FACHB-238]MBD2399609.1 large conductance mechanosensitive channel protein MscL [Leptolyngbya sp. FACHB-239]MBD2405814.1 large conduct